MSAVSADPLVSSVLVLSKHVYARRRSRNGVYDRGFIESKHDDSYMVLFADNTRERVSEDDLTWLGFRDLSPESWPKNPIIQPVMSMGEGSEEKASGFLEEATRDETRKWPVSLTVLEDQGKYNKNWSPWPLTAYNRSYWSASQSPMKQPRYSTHRDSSLHFQDEKDKKKVRSSVLRINRKALIKDLGQNNDDNPGSFSQEKDPAKTEVLSPSLSFQSTSSSSSSEYERKFHFSETMLKSRTPQTRHEEVFQETRCSCGPVEMPQCEPKYQNEVYEIDQEDVRYHSAKTFLSPCSDRLYQRLDYYDTSYLNQSIPTPPKTPSSPSSSSEFDLPSFDHETYRMPLFRETWRPNTNITPVVNEKKRRHDVKKCRKVYGVINRNLWCTQCRWKKACTRFQK